VWPQYCFASLLAVSMWALQCLIWNIYMTFPHSSVGTATSLPCYVPPPSSPSLQLSSLLLAAHHPAITSALPGGAAAYLWKVASSRIPALLKTLPGG
jgi:hypothetical protein